MSALREIRESAAQRSAQERSIVAVLEPIRLLVDDVPANASPDLKMFVLQLKALLNDPRKR